MGSAASGDLDKRVVVANLWLPDVNCPARPVSMGALRHFGVGLLVLAAGAFLSLPGLKTLHVGVAHAGCSAGVHHGSVHAHGHADDRHVHCGVAARSAAEGDDTGADPSGDSDQACGVCQLFGTLGKPPVVPQAAAIVLPTAPSPHRLMVASQSEPRPAAVSDLVCPRGPPTSG